MSDFLELNTNSTILIDLNDSAPSFIVFEAYRFAVDRLEKVANIRRSFEISLHNKLAIVRRLALTVER